MATGVSPDVLLQAEGVRPASPRRGPLHYLALVWRQVFVAPVVEGRLRDVGWPAGLRVVVVAVHIALLVGTALVLLGEPLRAVLPLTALATGGTIPRALVGLLLLLVSLSLATFLLACTHGPRWLLAAGLVIGVPLLLAMGLFAAIGTTGLTLMAVPLVLDAAAVAILVLVWRRHGPGRWQFPILFGLVLAQFVMVAADASARLVPLGFDPLPTVIVLQIGMLGPLANPLIFAAGTAPAQVSINVAIRAAALLGKGFGRSVTYTAMAAALLVASGHTAWLLLGHDVADLPWQTWAMTGVALAGWAAVVAGVLAASRTRWRSDEVAETGSALGWPAGAVLIGSAVPLLIVTMVLVLLTVVLPQLAWATTALQHSGSIVALRGIAAAAALAAAWWAVRRGHPVRAAVLGCAAVALLPYILTPLLDQEQGYTIDLTLISAALLAVLAASTVVLALRRKRLTETRAVAILAVSVLVVLVPHRGILAEPLEFLLGPGVGLILLGLWWQLLTESGVANRDSRSFPLATRVLLLLTSTLLTVVVLAFNVLTRQPAVGGMQQIVALGDDTLGLAMLAAAGGALLIDLTRDRLPTAP